MARAMAKAVPEFRPITYTYPTEYYTTSASISWLVLNHNFDLNFALMLSDPSHMSSDASPRASKRQRTEDVVLPTVKKHQRLWFDDGNIILVASDALGFRLHRGIMSLHSTVFRDMLSLPSNAQDNEMLEECPVVRLQECGDDLKLFFTLLYDGAKQ